MQGLSLSRVSTHHVGPLDLAIERGSLCGISGPSGAGKSLLLRAIADLDPHEGEISLDGVLQTDHIPNLWRSRVSYIPTESSWWETTVLEHFHGDNHSDITAWIERAGFSQDILQREVSRLSTGEKQRLAIVRHLQQRPDVLLLDEPTASLDSENTHRMERLISDYRQQEQAAILWVSHDPDQLQRICHQHYHFDQGRLSTVT